MCVNCNKIQHEGRVLSKCEGIKENFVVFPVTHTHTIMLLCIVRDCRKERGRQRQILHLPEYISFNNFLASHHFCIVIYLLAVYD